MANELITFNIPPHLRERIKLISVDHKVARLTDYHIGELGTFGFLDLAVVGMLGGKGSYAGGYSHLHIWGEISIPETAVTPLKEMTRKKGVDYLEAFKKSFGISQNPSLITSFKYPNAPFKEGVKYYSANHPNNLTPEIEEEAFRMQIMRAEAVLVGYIQRMEQWITQTAQNKLNSKIEYTGLAKVIHERQITCAQGDPRKLPQELFSSRLVS